MIFTTPGVTVIGKTEPMECELCGIEAEVRPYGPNGELVCFPCGMKDEKAAEAQFSKINNLKGETDV